MTSEATRCPVCAGPTAWFDEAQVLSRYLVTYLRCTKCRAVFAPEPFWLEEAYQSPITSEDTGLLRRSRVLANLTSAVITTEKLQGGRYLDWAGGYGTLAQMMRDRGHDFWHQDPFTPSIFAREYREDEGSGQVELVTAFEVLEHLTDPVTELAPVSRRTERMLVSTALLPEPAPQVHEWWYYAQEAGQHVTLYTEASLRHVARTLGFHLTTNGIGWHLLHRKPLRPATRVLFSRRLLRTAHRVRDRVRR